MKNLKFVGAFLFAFLVTPSLLAEDIVEIHLKDRLDGDLSEYCLDIAGGFQNVDPTRGLQVHTCLSYQGNGITPDQGLDRDGFDQGEFKVVGFDVCASLDSLEAGATVQLTSCNGSDAQSLTFAANGNISPKGASDMCLTAGEEVTFGRGGTSPHQIRTLTLQSCSDANASRQEWVARQH